MNIFFSFVTLIHIIFQSIKNPKMKKTYLFLLTLAMTAFFSCGGAEVKTEEKAEDKKEAKEEPKAEVKKDDAVPQIDVDALKDEAAFIEAMTKVKAARKMDDSLKDADKNYKGNFVKLLKLETAVRKKSTEFSKTLKSSDAVVFLKKIAEVSK